MDRPEEVKKHPDVTRFFQDLAKGDTGVMALLRAFWSFSQAFDDLMDESKWDDEKKQQGWKALRDFTNQLLLSRFVNDHRFELKALFESAIVRTITADTVMKDHPLAPAVRCGDVDILVHIAGLAHGWDKMIEVSNQRDYDVDKKGGV